MDPHRSAESCYALEFQNFKFLKRYDAIGFFYFQGMTTAVETQESAFKVF